MSVELSEADGRPPERGRSLAAPKAAGEGAWEFVLLVLILATLAALLRTALQPDLFADEVEHAHVTWLLGQGVMPYRDIHQIHLPMVWILLSPLLSVLPETLESLVILRMVCLLALAGSCAAAWLALDEVIERPTRAHRYSAILMALSVAGYFHFYRYRPDPFMAMFSAWAVLAVLRMHRNPRLYAFLAGAALGLAAGFSTKMAPMCLMVPLLSLFEAMRVRSWKPLLLGLPNLVGFLSTALPLLGWLHFHGIFDEFVAWSVVNIAQMIPFSWAQLSYFFVPGRSLWVFAVFCAAGAAALLAREYGAESKPWSPIRGILIATVLSWSVRALEPNHLDYNLQVAVMPAAVVGALALGWLWQWGPRWWQRALLAAALCLLLWRPIVTEGIRMDLWGESVKSDVMEKMISLTRGPETTCVGFAPYHPIFCRDASELYLMWDLRFIQMDWVSEAGKQPYREMWPRAIEDILAKRPALIVTGPWKYASRHGLVSEEKYQQLLELVEQEYQTLWLGKHRAWVRSERL